MVVSQLGVTKAQAQGGLGTIFQAGQANLGEADFATLSPIRTRYGELVIRRSGRIREHKGTDLSYGQRR